MGLDQFVVGTTTLSGEGETTFEPPCLGPTGRTDRENPCCSAIAATEFLTGDAAEGFEPNQPSPTWSLSAQSAINSRWGLRGQTRVRAGGGPPVRAGHSSPHARWLTSRSCP